ncbi:MAG: hypothetical protein DME22_15080 [Verrucomicrobia bacterium]|nr:MAG: hypothetical protein DME22_15080 [Verrucomicrobiota bacterium]
MEQLAADKLPPANDKTSLAALGFLTLGDHFNGNPNDVINDRIDVTSKAFLGLTVSCARCHDHKFDPIPQADYYSLHGIFASSVEPEMKPVISAVNTNYQDYLARHAELDARVQTVRTQSVAAAFGDYKRFGGVYLFATRLPEKERDAYLTKNGAEPARLKNWQRITQGGGRQAASIFAPWNMLSRIPEQRFAEQSRRILGNLDRNERGRQLNPHVMKALKGAAPRSMAELAAIYGNLLANPDPGWQTTVSTLLGDVALRVLPNKQRGQFFALREQSDMLEMVHPGAPARATTLVDGPNPKDSPIFIRGEAENPGEVVPRRFLEVLSGPNRPAFASGNITSAKASSRRPTILAISPRRRAIPSCSITWRAASWKRAGRSRNCTS